nr:MAG TPA: hypothetical protein [Caudoviricetes sp.]
MNNYHVYFHSILTGDRFRPIPFSSPVHPSLRQYRLVRRWVN